MSLPKPYYESDLGRLYHADCLEILPHLEPVDLVLTDPPYSSRTHNGARTRTVGANSNKLITFNPMQNIKDFLKCIEISKGWTVATIDWHFMNDLENNDVLVRFGIWIKPNSAPQLSGDRPAMGWEAIAICHKFSKFKWNGGGKRAVWTFNRVDAKHHETEKPISLFLSLLKDFSNNITDVVLDPFIGSGTTAIACERLKRRWIGIEIEEKYCEIAAKRIEAERKQLKLF